MKLWDSIKERWRRTDKTILLLCSAILIVILVTIIALNYRM